MSESIGQRIRRFRKLRGWTQYELAAEAEIERRSLHFWERDQRRMRLDSCAQIATALGISISELYDGTTQHADILARLSPTTLAGGD